jgi:lysophospholipase L1-like esterase
MVDKVTVADWSTIGDENDNIAGVKLAEGEAIISDLNDVSREIMAQAKAKFNAVDVAVVAAQSQGDGALAAANAAQSDADAAQVTANTAVANASTAQTTADAAQVTGANAQAEANIAQETANLAIDTSEEALAAALSGAKPPKALVRILTTTNVNPATGLVNGATIDGVVVATGNRVALAGNTAPAENGCYDVVAAGAAARSTDMDTGAELVGATFQIDVGTHAGEVHSVSTPSPITVGATAITIIKTGSASPVTAEVFDMRDGAATAQARLVRDGLPTVNPRFLSSAATMGTSSIVAEAAYGITTPDTLTSGAGSAYGNILPAPAAAALKSVTARMSAASTGEIHIVSVSGIILKAFPVSTSGAGLVTWSDFGNYVVPKGSNVFYLPLTGGHVRYVSGGICQFYSNAQYTGIGAQVTLAQTTATLALAYSLVSADVTLADTIRKASEALDAATNESGGVLVSASVGDSSPNVSTIGAGHIPVFPGYIDRPATLRQANVRVSSPATGEIQLYRQVMGHHYKLIKKQFVQLVTGDNPITSISGWSLKRGDVLAYNVLTGVFPRYTTVNGGVWRTFATADAPVIGSVVKMTNYSSPLLIPAMSLQYDYVQTGPLIAKSASNDDINGPLSIASEQFAGTSTPPMWVIGANFSVNNGLIATGAGAWNTGSYFDAYSASSRRRLSMRVRIDDAASDFGFGGQSYAGNAGLMIRINCVTGKMGTYYWDGTATPGTFGVDVNLPAIVVGREYVLSLVRTGLDTVVTFTDTITQAKCTINDVWAGGERRQLFGRPYIMSLAGTIKVIWADAHLDCPKTLRAVILGDSIAEGTQNASTFPSWAFQLASGRKDFLVCSRAGLTAANLILNGGLDIMSLTPRFAVIAIGTNDAASQATWRANVAQLISMVKFAGAEPVLCTMVPKTTQQATLTLMNTDIRTGYFGPYRYIDMARAVSTGNDGVTQNGALFTDGTHPNLAGETAMYEQVKADAPYLL